MLKIQQECMICQHSALPPEPEPSPAWQFAVAVVCAIVLIMLFPALKRKLRTFDGALEVSALSHQMWTCNLVLQYWIGHTKMLPAAVDMPNPNPNPDANPRSPCGSPSCPSRRARAS